MLVELARSGTPQARGMAAGALYILAANNADNRVAIAQAGAIPVLVELTRSGTPVAREQAAGALWSLGANAENRALLREAGWEA